MVLYKNSTADQVFPPGMEIAIYEQRAFSGLSMNTSAWSVVSNLRGDIRQCPAQPYIRDTCTLEISKIRSRGLRLLWFIADYLRIHTSNLSLMAYSLAASLFLCNKPTISSLQPSSPQALNRSRFPYPRL